MGSVADGTIALSKVGGVVATDVSTDSVASSVGTTEGDENSINAAGGCQRESTQIQMDSTTAKAARKSIRYSLFIMESAPFTVLVLFVADAARLPAI